MLTNVADSPSAFWSLLSSEKYSEMRKEESAIAPEVYHYLAATIFNTSYLAKSHTYNMRIVSLIKVKLRQEKMVMYRYKQAYKDIA